MFEVGNERPRQMPAEFKGKVHKSGGFTKSTPREWTDKELEWVASLADMGYSTRDIAESVGRTEVAVSVKLKRLGKKDGTYNADHAQDKQDVNMAFIQALNPKTLLDVFAGHKSVYSECDGLCVTSNDKRKEADTDFHMDALKLLCKLYSEGKKYDVIDLDPYGSAYDCFDLAIKMARRGLVVTFGELGHKRWKRLDFVRRYYGIESIEEFTLDVLVSKLREIAARNKKTLSVWEQREWRNIGRVWMTLDDMKITEQWDACE